MFGNTTPKERLGYFGILTVVVMFLCYVGAQQTHRQSAPLVIQEQSEHRTPITDKHEAKRKTNPPEKADEVVVDVVGAVKRPGVYTLGADKHLIDAVKAAGGFRHADEEKANLAAKLTDGAQYVIPRAKGWGESSTETAMAPEPSGDYLPAAVEVTGLHAAKKGKSPTEVIDLNSATAEQLQTIPGIGPSTAERILAYRSEHGAFRSVDELTSVGGIGAKKLEKMRPWLRV